MILGSKLLPCRLSRSLVLSSSLQSHLYLLVTDQGFLQEEQVVWESLHNVDGDSCFCDSDFHLSHSLGKEPGAEGGSGSPEKQRQVDQVCGTFLALVSCMHCSHLEMVTSDTCAPLLCYLGTISTLGVSSLSSQRYTWLCVLLWRRGNQRS